MRAKVLIVAAIGLAATTMASSKPPPTAQPASNSAAVDAEVRSLVSRMTVERKVGQIIMPDISTITPDDVRQYRFGTILNGGNSGPGGNDLAPAKDWLALADAIWAASTTPLPNGEPVIPVLWGTDAVHGHNNIAGATIFPHNIGLGATRDAKLLERIGSATAAEVAVTGIDWTFAPTLAVATDSRWGRSYESFSEDPALVARLGAANITGLQGRPGTNSFLDQTKVIATAKHFLGDGGTGGKDRGDTRGNIAELKRVHGAPYPAAIAAGVQTVMASFSSVNGVKMHGNSALLTNVLRKEMGFRGLVLGDWNGHGELAGCTNTNCPQSLLAGVDVYMVPEDWKGLFATLLQQVRDGTIPMSRLDEAVSRILHVKLAYRLLEKPRPAERVLAGKWEMLGSPEHRAIAREAVQKSLVLLKNDGILPLRNNVHVLVAGKAADSVARQVGGWSLTWQGGGTLGNSNFPGATSIYSGIKAAMAQGSGRAQLSVDGSYTQRPDVAVVVFGEEPYAEFVGDREDFALRDEEGLTLLRKYRAEGIPTVAVLLSGRPLWMNRELDVADAFVAAWLPGSEGAGVADVLIGNASGKPRHDFTGRLGFQWPGECEPHAKILVPVGAGWSYSVKLPRLTLGTDCSLLTRDFKSGLRLFERGLNPAVNATIEDDGGTAPLANFAGSSPANGLRVSSFDRNAQEDARRLTWTRAGKVNLNWNGASLPSNAVIVLDIQTGTRTTSRISLAPRGGELSANLDITSSFELASGKGWRRLQIPLACLGVGVPTGVALQSNGPFEFELASLGILPGSTTVDCKGPF
ncbi:MAG: glycoside hydrolase family 3 N-terminal domain-containing protein [Sphingomonadaceae bacterium]